jgi:hypothetical protein
MDGTLSPLLGTGGRSLPRGVRSRPSAFLSGRTRPTRPAAPGADASHDRPYARRRGPRPRDEGIHILGVRDAQGGLLGPFLTAPAKAPTLKPSIRPPTPPSGVGPSRARRTDNGTAGPTDRKRDAASGRLAGLRGHIGGRLPRPAAPTAYKIAAPWSNGISLELKSYGLACEAHCGSLLALAQLRKGLKLAFGETVGPVGLYRLEPGKRDANLIQMPDH